ncbi:hypothetical protein BKA62DRAFT_687113 [Auriculariales sp. MPI-PUGE-AT-0066]|nr:hypothetical protein BKA62DRAFT_687113 [Auriculariales sp. MPI-PUGE-AT-0066]
MATPGQSTVLERAEVHKSCKALEVLVNAFQDYCQALTAVAGFEKKLVKALKDVASSRATADTAVNACNAAVQILETVADIDGKLSKLLDKESDQISNDIRRWFKKLAKEEKLHDDKIQVVNNKVKAAAQAFEKKSKKKAADAAEEHTKYMNLLTVVGPEMAADKQSHAVFVTQRHNAITSAVAATFARVAEAEWSRVCESIRRCAPNIGTVGQWRAFCEGEFIGTVPADLPGDDLTSLDSTPAPTPGTEPRVWQPNELATFAQVAAAVVQQQQMQQYSQSQPPVERDSQPPSPVAPLSNYNNLGLAPPASEPQPSSSKPTTPEPMPLSRTTTSSDVVNTPGIVASSTATVSSPAVPAPPTPTTKPVAAKSSPNAISAGHLIGLSPPAAEPRPGGASDGPPTPRLTPSASEESNKMPMTPPETQLGMNGSLEGKAATGMGIPMPRATRTFSPPPPAFPTSPADRAQTTIHEAFEPQHTGGDYLDQGERRVSPTALRQHMTGVGTGINIASRQQDERDRIAAHSTGVGVGRRISIDSTSSQSHVAAMRDRYVDRKMPGSPPPGPRDLPQIGSRVADMATRYTPIDQPSPQRPGVSTPLLERDRAFPDQSYPLSPSRSTPRGNSYYGGGNGAMSPGTERDWQDSPTAGRRQQLEKELAQLHQEELAQRERDLYRQQEQLNRERQHLATMRPDRDHERDPLPSFSNDSRDVSYSSRSTSYSGLAYARPPSASGPSSYGHSRRSGSPTPHASNASNAQSGSSGSGGGHLAAPARNAGHSPNCGCWECSAKHYSNPSSPVRSNAGLPPSPGRPAQRLPSPTTTPTAAPVPGNGTTKKGNWVRRLSMPVIAGAFQNDAIKPKATTPLGPVASMGPSLLAPQSTGSTTDDRAGRRSFDRDGVGSFGQRRDNQQAGYTSLNSNIGRR